ncbi:MAG: IPT/TIG domain-containing protein [Dehalococcoidia bacterium]
MTIHRTASQATRLLAGAVLAVVLTLGAALVQGPTPVAAANPTFASIVPGTGSTAGGTPVTITGSNFTSGAAVYIGGGAATNVVVVNSTQITATSPAGAQGSANLLIVNPDNTAVTATAAYFFTSPTGALSLTSIEPSSGGAGGGQLVNVYGSGFQAGLTITFGGIASTSITVLSSSTLLVRTPSGLSGTVSVTVTNPDNSTATLPTGYTFGTPAPFTVSSVTPTSGSTAGGTVVTVAGSGFTSGSTVRFGSAQAGGVQFVSSTQINATTPPGSAGVVSVTVTSALNESASAAAAFTYTTGTTTTTPTQTTGALTVSGVTPNVGTSAGGSIVTVTGTGFQPNAAVLFGLLPATNVTVVGPSQITATTPANTVAVGPVSVTVVNPGGASGALTSAYTYGVSTNPLSVTSIAPISGSVNGGTVVTVNGTGLSSVSSVQFGGVPGTSLSVVSDSKVTVVTPARSAGPVALTVIAGGSSTTLPNGFVYSTAPAITLTTVTPSSGTTSGGASVTLTGTGFASGMTAAFGGSLGTNLVVISPTQATVTTPARAAGVVEVTVGLPGGDSASLPSAFTYQATGTISAPMPAQGFALFVFSGGTNQQLVTASGCTGNTSAFWATDAAGQFVVYVPGTSVGAVNAGWNSMFPAGLPSNTPLIGKCS